jgi:hypothetical protein
MPDSSRQVAAISSALACNWARAEISRNDLGREVMHGATTAHVRIDASHRCAAAAPTGSSCTLQIIYDQWSSKRNELHAELARYRREYAAKTGAGSWISEAFSFFSAFGVPVDPILLESIGPIGPEEQVLEASWELRASRSCFTNRESTSGAGMVLSMLLDDSGPEQLGRFMGAMLLSAWLDETKEQSPGGDVDRAETLGTITFELTAIRAQKNPASLFELPAGFTKAP